jgi:hypothetical protein
VTEFRLGSPPLRAESSSEEPSGVRATARAPYIRGLITLVLLVTIVEGLIDLTLKARATEMGAGGSLLSFFAMFYTALSLLTVVFQAAISRRALEKLGPARAAALLPAGTAVAATAAAFSPGLVTAAIARGVEYVLSNSVYRGGYEVLFTPVPAREKRSIKALADVGASRTGDIIAAGLAAAAIALPFARPAIPLMALAVALSIVAIVIAYRLHAGYVQTLARGLVSRAVQLDLRDVEDPTTRSTVLQTLGPFALSQIFRLPREGTTSTPRPAGQPGDPVSGDSVQSMAAREAEETEELRLVRDLHSRDPERARRGLRSGRLSAVHVPHLIPLLGWDDVARDAIEALRRTGPEATAPLVVSLLDPNTDFVIRRRIPLVLATYKDPASVRGLDQALNDPRFEVRYRAGRALAHLVELDPSLSMTREEAFLAVLREVEMGTGVWESRKVFDRMDDEGWSPVMDEMVRDRANRSLEHVFTLLALALPRQPLRIAFKGLHTDDPLLRGTALEYLESSLPPEIRKKLWPYLEDTRPKRQAQETRPREKVLQDLLESNHSIVIRLEELRQKEDNEA